jgi:hypothetical protein
VGAVDEGLAEVELAAFDEVVREPLEHVFQRSAFHPTLEASEARGVRRIPVGHVCPWSSGAEDPEHAVENISRIAPWSSATILSNRKSRKKRLKCCPLLIGQVHRDFRSQPRSAVDLMTFRSDFAALPVAHL